MPRPSARQIARSPWSRVPMFMAFFVVGALLFSKALMWLLGISFFSAEEREQVSRLVEHIGGGDVRLEDEVQRPGWARMAVDCELGTAHVAWRFGVDEDGALAVEVPVSHASDNTQRYITLTAPEIGADTHERLVERYGDPLWCPPAGQVEQAA